MGQTLVCHWYGHCQSIFWEKSSKSVCTAFRLVLQCGWLLFRACCAAVFHRATSSIHRATLGKFSWITVVPQHSLLKAHHQSKFAAPPSCTSSTFSKSASSRHGFMSRASSGRCGACLWRLFLLMTVLADVQLELTDSLHRLETHCCLVAVGAASTACEQSSGISAGSRWGCPATATRPPCSNSL